MSGRSDDQPRQRDKPGIESWFLRAVHPEEPRAIWLKATTLGTDDGAPISEAWCSVFDGERTYGVKTTVPLHEATFGGEPLAIEIDGCVFDLDPAGGALKGRLSDERGELEWDLAIERHPGPLGNPLSMLPSRKLIDAPLPRNKGLTPAPVLHFDGTFTWDGDEFAVDSWWGSYGHNWGATHPVDYGWAQCVFLDADGEPFGYVEGITTRIAVAGRTTPQLSLLAVRRGDREYRFTRGLDIWNQRGTVDFPRWALEISSPDGEAAITVEGDPRRMVCLGYFNPDGALSYCLNSKTASVTLRVNPINEDGFELVSRHGGALEFLQDQPEPRVQPVV